MRDARPSGWRTAALGTAALLALLVSAGVFPAHGAAGAQVAARHAVPSVTVTRADGTLTASWDAPAGAASYHVTYSDNGAQSWQLAALDHAATSITFSVENAKTYIVGVAREERRRGQRLAQLRARRVRTPRRPRRRRPRRWPRVTVTRADGTLTASWDAPAGAASYHVTYTDNGAQSWQLAALDHAATSITFAATNGSTYIVGVRAKNAGGGSNLAQLRARRAAHAA